MDNTKKRFIVIGIIILAMAIASAYKLYFNKPNCITATGTVEITLADITPRINGYVQELNIERGDIVNKGQIIAKLRRTDMNAQLVADAAALAKARSTLIDMESGARPQEVLSAQASMVSAQAVYDKANSDLRRGEYLFSKGAISEQQLDSLKSNNNVSLNALRGAQAQYSLVNAGTRPDQIEAQRMEVKRLQAALEVSQSNIDDLTLRAPIDGQILTKNFEQGEYINAGSAIATVGDMNDCWVKVYVSSAQLGLIKVGQVADVKVDSYPNRVFTGTIKEIAQNAQFTPRQSITQSERANLVFEVKVKIDNAANILKPGMPADVVLK